jgi:hypothetical protein
MPPRRGGIGTDSTRSTTACHYPCKTLTPTHQTEPRFGHSAAGNPNCQQERQPYNPAVPLVPRTRPPYKNVPRVIVSVLWQLARGAPASLTLIERLLFAGMTPPPRVRGVELIPSESPFVAIFNHYESARVAAWWGPLQMTRAIAEHRTREPRQVRWLMTREWWYPSGFGRAVKQPLTHLLFARLAQVYSLVPVPPVLPGDLTRGDGVAGVRHALALTRGLEPELVGLAPEGNTGPGGALQEPPSGVGLFLLLLTREEIPLLPIGWYEDEPRVLTISFGVPFQLHVPRMKDRHARDRAAATQAMTAIGRVLPERLWGAYSSQIDKLSPRVHHTRDHPTTRLGD